MKMFGISALAAILSWTIRVFSSQSLDASDPLLNGKWFPITEPQEMLAFHTCFVLVGRKAVVLGGRYLEEPQIFDPVTRTWTKGQSPPGNIKLHHSQCVVVDQKIWIVAAWIGGYPREKQAEYIYIYDPNANTWKTRAPMPEPRRRGSAATVAVGHLIYVAFGNRGGHERDNFAESFSYLDVYDTMTDSWTPRASARYPRDHAGGALLADGRICVGGGRDGGTKRWPGIPQTECYNISSNEWSTEADVPELKGAAAYGSSCDGRLLMAGGDGKDKSGRYESDTFHMFDGANWTRLEDVQDSWDPGHCLGLAVDCVCDAIYLLSRTENDNYIVESFFPGGIAKTCNA